MKWFGTSWGAPVCDVDEQVPVPDGEACPHCMSSIRAHDSGFQMPYIHDDNFVDTLDYHRECLLCEIIPDNPCGRPGCVFKRL